MIRKLLVSCAIAIALAMALSRASAQAPAQLSAAAIVEKNVAARGGLQAWKRVETLSFAGKMGAGGNQRTPVPAPAPGRRGAAAQQLLPTRPANEAQLPFVMKLERPRKVRLELQFNGQTAIQVFDGVQGWKVRPFLNRREVEPYTSDEMKIASTQADLDGPLVDYAAKGTTIDVEGTEKVENRDTYKIKLTEKSGHVFHIWIDAKTFLEAKMEGQPRELDGMEHPVEIYYRDFRSVSGLQIPYVLETKVLPVASTGRGVRNTPIPSEQITIDKVEVNPKFDAATFAKPAA
jgi:outer membrane lipoprotein-sorting protein